MKLYPTLLLAALAASALVIAGCDSKVPTGAGTTGTTAGGTAAAGSKNASAGASASSTTTDTANMTDAEYVASNKWETDPDLMISKVPNSLKALPCFQYEGFAGSPTSMMMTSTNSAEVRTGTVSFHLKRVTDDAAYFVIARTGTLGAQLGNDLVVLRKDGVFNLANSQFKLSKESMEMPAQMQVGTKWNIKLTASTEAFSIDQDLNLQLKSPETISLPNGTHQALVIEATGTSVRSGQTSHTFNRVYCVANMGEVKTVVTEKGPTGKRASITIQPSDKKSLAAAYKAAAAFAKSQGGSPPLGGKGK